MVIGNKKNYKAKHIFDSRLPGGVNKEIKKHTYLKQHFLGWVIKTDEKNYEINLAVAGFSESEIEIISLQNILYIKGKKVQNNSQNIIHKGIALRPFEKKFNLDPLMEVTEATLSQGLLNIKLFKREPEIIKPKRIEIKTT